MKNEFNEQTHQWGGSGIEKSLFDFVKTQIKKDDIIIEFGSGYCSTKAFASLCTLYSIDDNRRYQNLSDNVKYIQAPLIYGWYDSETVVKNIPNHYSLIFIDGPAGAGNRNGILNNLNIFIDVPFIIHDIYRSEEETLAKNIASRLNKTCKFYKDNDYWAYIS